MSPSFCWMSRCIFFCSHLVCLKIPNIHPLSSVRKWLSHHKFRFPCHVWLPKGTCHVSSSISPWSMAYMALNLTVFATSTTSRPSCSRVDLGSSSHFCRRRNASPRPWSSRDFAARASWGCHTWDRHDIHDRGDRTSTSIVIPFRDKINPPSMVICLNPIPQTNLYWLVVYLPLWKIWKSIGIIVPNIWKNKILFQTTKQYSFWGVLKQ